VGGFEVAGFRGAPGTKFSAGEINHAAGVTGTDVFDKGATGGQFHIVWVRGEGQ
jgi:hypothetical protein